MPKEWAKILGVPCKTLLVSLLFIINGSSYFLFILTVVRSCIAVSIAMQCSSDTPLSMFNPCVTTHRDNPNSNHKRDYCDLIEHSAVAYGTLYSQAYTVVCSQFVAHPYSQLMLNSVLYDKLGGWEDSGFLTKLILGLLMTVSGPLLALCYFLFPDSRISNLLRRPIVKFTSHTGSFCMFLMLLILSSVQDKFYNVLQFQVFGKYIFIYLHLLLLCCFLLEAKMLWRFSRISSVLHRLQARQHLKSQLVSLTTNKKLSPCVSTHSG